MSFKFVFSGVLLSVRSRFFYFFITAFFILVITSYASALFSGRQPATVALDVGISVIRYLLPIAVIILCQDLVYREFERRYFLNSLTYPEARWSFVVGKLICMALILTLLLVFLSFTLAFLVWLVSQGYQQATPVNLLSNYAIVIAFVGVDALVLLVLGLLVSIVSTSQSFLMVGVLGFMLIARSYSSVIELLGVNDYVVSDPDSYSFGLGGLRFFLPDLGALDVREIALYSNLELLPSGWPFLLYSSLSYAGLILFLAILALYKKRFS